MLTEKRISDVKCMKTLEQCHKCENFRTEPSAYKGVNFFCVRD